MAELRFRSDKRISECQRGLLRAFCCEIGGEIVDLAKDLGLKVYAEDLWPYQSGYLEYAPTCGSASNYRIVVNRAHTPERQRFTAAHEMAHFLLHREDSDFEVATETKHRSNDYFEYLEVGDTAKEAEANRFASALLMPPNLFIPSCKRLKKNVAALSKLFVVSESAVERRIIELKL